MDKLELSIIIVDYKSSDNTIALVSDLLKRLDNLRFEIIVVDNDPKSDAADVIGKKFAADRRVVVIKSETNSGFGAGNNLGAKSANGEFLLLLNPDTKIYDDAVERMLDFLAKHSEIGALTPLIYQADGKNLQRHFFGRFQSLSSLILRNQAGKMPKKTADFFYAEMITAAALMIRRELFQKLLGFDQKFFMYLEDEDLCRRITKLGYKNVVLATAKVIHFEGKSSSDFEKKKFYYKSQNYYWQKHHGIFQTVLMKLLRSPYVLLQKNDWEIKKAPRFSKEPGVKETGS